METVTQNHRWAMGDQWVVGSPAPPDTSAASVTQGASPGGDDWKNVRARIPKYTRPKQCNISKHANWGGGGGITQGPTLRQRTTGNSDCWEMRVSPHTLLSPQFVTQSKVLNPETTHIHTPKMDSEGCIYIFVFLHMWQHIIKIKKLSIWEWRVGGSRGKRRRGWCNYIFF